MFLKKYKKTILHKKKLLYGVFFSIVQRHHESIHRWRNRSSVPWTQITKSSWAVDHFLRSNFRPLGVLYWTRILWSLLPFCCLEILAGMILWILSCSSNFQRKSWNSGKIVWSVFTLRKGLVIFAIISIRIKKPLFSCETYDNLWNHCKSSIQTKINTETYYYASYLILIRRYYHQLWYNAFTQYLPGHLQWLYQLQREKQANRIYLVILQIFGKRFYRDTCYAHPSCWNWIHDHISKGSDHHHAGWKKNIFWHYSLRYRYMIRNTRYFGIPRDHWEWNKQKSNNYDRYWSSMSWCCSAKYRQTYPSWWSVIIYALCFRSSLLSLRKERSMSMMRANTYFCCKSSLYSRSKFLWIRRIISERARTTYCFCLRRRWIGLVS